MSEIQESLVSLRKAKNLSQEGLGKAIAGHLNHHIGQSYAQKKIGRFESGVASPTGDELHAMSVILDIDLERLRSIFAARAPLEGPSVVEQVSNSSEGGRSLIATCLLSRARPQTLEESYQAIKESVEERNLSLAAFVPYPNRVNVPEPSDHISNLVGHYARVRKSISESNLSFKNSLAKDKTDQVGLYFPKAEFSQSSAILIPPVFRQFSLSFQQRKLHEPFTKTLHIWTPGPDSDDAKQVRPTGVYSLAEHIDAWESFFGDVVTQWMITGKLPFSDPYWERVR